MKKRNQAYIAEKMGVSTTFVNRLVNTDKRPSWKRAKQIAEITNTDPVLWLDGSRDQLRAAYNKWKGAA